MLRLVGTRIRWQRSDKRAMAKIVGGETAAKRSAAYNPSIVKLAVRRGLDVHAKLRKLLAIAKTESRVARQLAAQLDAKPATRFEKTAFGHQRSGLAFTRAMQRPAYLIADKAGVGKTLLAILWAYEVTRSRRILVITPNSAKEQWADAIRHWLDPKAKITIVEGEKEKRRDRKVPKQIEEASTPTGWVIGHWESLVNAEAGYRAHPWDVIILDEAHKICNRDTLRSIIASKLEATYRMALTATPFSNDESELWGILRFLYPDTYTSFWTWAGLHVEMDEGAFGATTFSGARRPKLLQWELAPFTLARTKEQVFPDTPRIDRIARHVELTARGEREYGRLKKLFFAELDAIAGDTKTVVIPSELPRLMRLRQYLVDPGLLGGREPSLKYPEILELVEEVGEPMVVFSSFRQALLRLNVFLTSKKAGSRRVGLIAGGMKSREVNAVKHKFLDGRYDVLSVVTQKGSEALNLGRFGVVAHLDLPFTPRELEQSEGRVDRPEEKTGHMVPTTAYRIIVRNSYEERLEAKLTDKHIRFQKIFTKGDLRELFA